MVKYYKVQLLSLLEEIYLRSKRNSVFNMSATHKPFDTKNAFLSLYRFLNDFKICERRPSGGGERFMWLSPEEPKNIIDDVVSMLAEHEKNGHFVCIGDTVPESLKIEEPRTRDKRKIGFETNEDKIIEYALERGKEFTYGEICQDLNEKVNVKSISAILSILSKAGGSLVRLKTGVYVHQDFSDGQTSVFSQRNDEIVNSFERSIVTLISDNGSMTLKDLHDKLGHGLQYMTFQQRLTSLCRRNVLKKLDRGVYSVFKKEQISKVETELKTNTQLQKIETAATEENSPINKDFRTKLSTCLSQIEELEASIIEKRLALEEEEKKLKSEKSRLEVMLSMKSVYMN